MSKKYALITGASRGIGRAFSLILAEQGYNLILVSRDQYALTKLSHLVSDKYDVHVFIYAIDLSEQQAASSVFEYVQSIKVTPSFFINNAGIYSNGPFSSSSWEKELEILQLSCISLTHLTKLFLKEIKNGHDDAFILNVASNGAFVPGPFNAVYCASKAYILSFTEALSEELRDTKIKVSALCPGGVDTHFQDLKLRKKSWMFPLLEPNFVARKGINGVRKGRRVVTPGIIYHLQYLLLRFIPRKLLLKMAANMVENNPAPKHSKSPPIKTEYL